MKNLVEQLAILRQWDKSIWAKSFYKNKKENHKALTTALDQFEACQDTDPNILELSENTCGENAGGEAKEEEFNDDDDKLYYS